MVGQTELSAHITQQIGRLDAILFERLIFDAKECRKRRAEHRNLHLEFINQHRFQIDILAPRRPLCEFKFFGRYHRIGHQRIVLATHLNSGGSLFLAKCDG